MLLVSWRKRSDSLERSKALKKLKTANELFDLRLNDCYKQLSNSAACPHRIATQYEANRIRTSIIVNTQYQA